MAIGNSRDFHFDRLFEYSSDPVKVRGLRYNMKRVATNTNSKDIFDFDKQQQRKLKINISNIKS